MKIIEALNVVQSPLPEALRRLRVFLACCFTPLHLQTFLLANLRVRLRGVLPEIRTGMFGDLVGTIEQSNPSETDVLVVGTAEYLHWRSPNVHLRPFAMLDSRFS